MDGNFGWNSQQGREPVVASGMLTCPEALHPSSGGRLEMQIADVVTLGWRSRTRHEARENCSFLVQVTPAV